MSVRTEVRLLALPWRESLDASHGTPAGAARPLTVVSLVEGESTGWGECSALGTAGYTTETARSAFDVLRGADPVDPTRSPMAAAAVAMARLDLVLRGRGQSLAASLGAARTTVVAGGVVGLGARDEVIERVDRLVADGYRRVKLKIEPGHDRTIAAAVRERHPGLELQADANGSYRSDDLGALQALDEVGLSVIEQPFPVGEERLAAPLVEGARAVIVWDESVRGRADAERLRASGLLGGLSVKPGPLGGVVAAADLVSWAAERDVPVMVGGLLESGLGRRALAAVAALPGVDLVGDLSPARRWLAADPWPDLTMRNGRIEVPTTPGVAPLPDPDLLDALTVDRAVAGDR